MFDRFAAIVSKQVARAWFFTACVVLVALWLPSYFLIGTIDTWQLIINTITTIVTFLLVALLQNGQAALEARIDSRLATIIAALDAVDPHPPSDDPHQEG